MSLNLACLNMRKLEDPNKCMHLLGELLKLLAHVAAVQETHFTCRMLKNDFVVLSVLLC